LRESRGTGNAIQSDSTVPIPLIRGVMNRQKLIKWSIVAGKLAILALLVWFIHGTVDKAIRDLREHTWHVDWPWLVLSGALYLLAILPAGEYWYQILRAADQPVQRYSGLRSFYVSQIGKYVPGKAMVLVLRAAMVRAQRVPTTIVTLAVVLETLTNMADGALVALIILLPQLSEHPDLLAAAVAMLLVTGLPILPPLFKFALRFSGLVKLNPGAIKKLDQLGYRTIGWGMLTMAAGWWIQGLSLWAVLRSLGAVDGGPMQNWPLHTAVAALSVVAGFLAFIPGGLGVREFVIIEIFTPIYGPAHAVVSAILLRLVSVVSDALVSIILYLVRPASARPGNAVDVEPLEAGSNH
jgi:glycosyltransferase 2 family protein